VKIEYTVVAICIVIIILIAACAIRHKIKAEYLISGVALVISIAFGIISWKTSYKANNLQTEVLNITKQSKEFEIRKGEILLISLLGRYFVIQLNCWEQDGKMKTDKISVEKYIHELKQLCEDVDGLVPNPFYIEVLEKYPEINLLWISLRGSIIDREQDQGMAVNPQTFNQFYDLYFKIKKKINNTDMLKNQFYQSTDDAAEFLKREIQKLKQMNG